MDSIKLWVLCNLLIGAEQAAGVAHLLRLADAVLMG